jgi:hypothetical protein
VLAEQRAIGTEGRIVGHGRDVMGRVKSNSCRPVVLRLGRTRSMTAA